MPLSAPPTARFDFFACAEALQSWDLPAVRRQLGLDDDIPLHAVADLVARLGHMDGMAPQDVVHAVRTSALLPYLQGAGLADRVEDFLAPVCEFVKVDQPTVEAQGDTLLR